MAQLIDGKAVAARVREQVRQDVVRLQAERGFVPGLAVVRVGEDPASKVYVTGKKKAAAEVGFHSWEHALPESTTQAQLLALVEQLNADPAVHGILVQLPLPRHVDADVVISAVRPEKDVDGFHPMNAGR